MFMRIWEGRIGEAVIARSPVVLRKEVYSVYQIPPIQFIYTDPILLTSIPTSLFLVQTWYSQTRSEQEASINRLQCNNANGSPEGEEEAA